MNTAAAVLKPMNACETSSQKRQLSKSSWNSLRTMLRVTDEPAVAETSHRSKYHPSAPDRTSRWEYQMATPNSEYWRTGRRR